MKENETFVEAAGIGATARDGQFRLWKRHPVAAKGRPTRCATWLLTRTQYKEK